MYHAKSDEGLVQVCQSYGVVCLAGDRDRSELMVKSSWMQSDMLVQGSGQLLLFFFFFISMGQKVSKIRVWPCA